ncbi:hypothetical protein DSM112329_00357 [Paraconexibacter sp. AEG42_29]|uniref:Metallo-beta-lactamase domain-containing protein n=1 Tax=Paraconexibacter sp. AEG42_29 TaxID=2997339 RepID=A0AAU7APD6_9ACTN
MSGVRASGAGSRTPPGAPVAPGIHLLPVPTGLPVGDVNVYLIDGERPTLVDCGPRGAAPLAALQAALDAHGVRLADLGLLVVTHPHPDHFGLAAEFVRQSGVAVACLDAGAAVLEDWDAWTLLNDDAVHHGLLRHGVPRELAQSLRADGHSGRAYAESVPVARTLRAGELLTLGDRTFEVLHLPGHSPADTALLDRTAGVLLAGDHLLAAISSNAIVARPFGDVWDGRRPAALLDYRRSLRRTRALEVDLVLGGHGPPVTGHRALIDARLAAHDARADRLLALAGAEPVTAHELAVRLWGQVAVAQAFATLSEVLGHLDLLIERGRLVEDRTAAVIRFRAT